MEASENGENKASDIHSMDFPFICRICLRRGDLRLFEQEDYLLDLFVTITKIDVRSAVNFPSNICNECINELEDISLFIDIAKYNDSRPGKNIIPKKENEFVAIVDFGTSQEPVVKDEKTKEDYEEDAEKPEMCRICFVTSCLTPFEEKVDLMQLFQNITNIDLEAASNFSSKDKICNKCIDKLESISLFISLALSNDTKFESIIGKNESLKTENCSEGFSVSKGNDLKFDNISDTKEVEVGNYSNESVCSYENKDLHTVVDIKEEILHSPKAPVREYDQKGLELCSKTESDPREKEFSSETRPTIFSKGLGVSSEAHLITKKCKCNFCKKKFNRRKLLKLHSLTHIREKLFKCDICNKYFRLKGDLNRHKLIHAGEKPFTCDSCQKGFNRKSNLKMHMVTHNGEKPFECDSCEKSFCLKRVLKTHMLTHSEEKTFTCDSCQKGFSQKGYLSRHMLTHTGEKPFECDSCGKSFSRNQSLKRHMLTHTGEKPFKCDSCEKSFIQKQSLKAHMLTHTGEKLLKCDCCEKQFTCKQSLKRHVLTHTEVKTFACDMCQKGFSRKCYLIQHIRTHTTPKPLKCDSCGKSFSRNQSLKRHMLSHTRKKNVQM